MLRKYCLFLLMGAVIVVAACDRASDELPNYAAEAAKLKEGYKDVAAADRDAQQLLQRITTNIESVIRGKSAALRVLLGELVFI